MLMTMKKTYIIPTLEVVRVETQQMLALSGGVSNGSGVGNSFNDGDVSYSRDMFIDGEY